MIAFSAIATASLDQLTDELGAAGWDSSQKSEFAARVAVARLAHETQGPFDLCDSETGNVIREATEEEAVESVCAGPEGHIAVDWRKAGGWNGEDYRRCYVAE
jgi:hypothetical protein